MKRKVVTECFLVMLMTALLLCASLSDGHCGDPQWRDEFDETCANTSAAMTLSLEDLQQLIVKCERLQIAIEQLDESARKVFLKRLLMCKNLYQFVLDTKKSAQEPKAQ